jgi:hypothetical protein
LEQKRKKIWPLPLQEELELDEEVDLGETEELEEGELDIDEDMIQELVEELVVDMMPVKTGWLATPQGEMQYAEELELARRSGTEAQEQIKGSSGCPRPSCYYKRIYYQAK